MVIDPRTLRPVTKESECHLIPGCFGVSNKTVLLDGPFDNKIGEQCDSHLKLYFDLLVGADLKGKFAFAGGSQTMAGTVRPVTQQFSIKQQIRLYKKRRQKRWPPNDWCRKALGMGDDGQVKIENFVTPPVNLLKARLSMVNSAILILHFLGRKEIYKPEFDLARALLNKACEDKLNQSNLPQIEELTPEFGLVYISPEKTKGLCAFNPADLRRYYDPSVDMADDVMDDFPRNCVTEVQGSLIVRLPHGKGLRGAVRFPHQSAHPPQ